MGRSEHQNGANIWKTIKKYNKGGDAQGLRKKYQIIYADP